MIFHIFIIMISVTVTVETPRYIARKYVFDLPVSANKIFINYAKAENKGLTNMKLINEARAKKNLQKLIK